MQINEAVKRIICFFFGHFWELNRGPDSSVLAICADCGKKMYEDEYE